MGRTTVEKFRQALRKIIRPGFTGSESGVSLVSMAIILCLLIGAILVVITSVIPRMSSYSSRTQIAEAVGMAAGYPLSIGDTGATSKPDPVAAAASLRSFASLVAGNSVPTCAFLVEALGSRSGGDCTVSATQYDPGLIPPQASTGAVCSAGLLVKAQALQKVERLAASDCDAKAYYGVTQPLDDSLATSPSQHAVQKGSAAKTVLYTTGGT